MGSFMRALKPPSNGAAASTFISPDMPLPGRNNPDHRPHNAAHRTLEKELKEKDR